MNKPLLPLNLPRLSEELEQKLLTIASSHKDFSYSRMTLGERYQNAVATGDTATLSALDNVKQLYGFGDLPQHLAQNIPRELIQQIESEIGLTLPQNAGVFVQVVECANTFIHTDGGVRKASLYYMLTDDSTAETRFYKSDKEPFYSTIWNPNEVEQFYSYRMEQHRWHSFSHDEIHSVNNVTKLRVGLLIDMTRAFPTYEDFMENFKWAM
jgi:hypothetical protein